MKKVGIFLAALLASIALGAQTPEQTGGKYYAYPAPAGVVYHAAPAGFEPFYISHYGRHGSRWLTHEERYDRLLSYFGDKGNLTAEGKVVAAKVKAIYKDGRKNAGKLSPVGASQQRGIAGRMYRNFPGVFRNGAVIHAVSSTVGRCISSMEAFTGELRKLDKSLAVYSSSDPAHMAYIAGGSKEIDDMEENLSFPIGESPDRLVCALFKDTSKVADKYWLMKELHNAASDIQDITLKTSLYDIFTQEEMLAIYDRNNLAKNTIDGDVVRNGGLSATASIPLWQDIVARADAAVAAGSPAANLRFGHETYLLHLAAFLQLERAWEMDKVIPMAANLQMVFYRNPEGTVLVKFLFNEKEARIPAPTDIWPYYAWEDVKDYYATRIERLGHLRTLNAINTMVGTDKNTTASSSRFGKGSEELGQTLPAVLSPNGQTFWTPQTRDTEKKGVSPFYYSDGKFQGFRASHWLTGGATQDYGSFTIAPISGRLRLSPEERATAYDHSLESAHPHYYSVVLPDEHLQAEMTATSHCAVFRITPGQDGDIHIVLNHNSDEGVGTVRIDTLNHVIYATNPIHRIYQGWGKSANYSGHLVLVYKDRPVDAGVKDGIAYLTFKGRKTRPLEFCASTSFTGYEGAMLNLQTEIGDKDFEDVAAGLAEVWCEKLHRIDIESDDTAAVNQFYGALYRASFLPREISDCDGSFPRFVYGTTMKRKGRHFTDFSLWDTYRALHPLLTIIEPSLSGELMQSLADMAYEGGWMPIFPCWNSYTSEMIGDHAASVIADAYLKGIRNFDIEKAYDGLRQNAFGTPARYEDYAEGKGRRAVVSYWEYGYIPLEDKVEEAYHKGEQVSRTLEYAYDDYALAQLSKALGKDYDHNVLMKRSAYWRNVFDPAIRWMNGRHSDGRFEVAPDLTANLSWITEGCDLHYSWYVPQDPQGLIAAMGGSDAVCSRLDELFDRGYYWHGNEPCHQIAYMYALAGHPEKTRQRVSHILETEYDDTAGGLSGTDDAGQMSAWYILSSLGFYPLCPASGEYVVGTPAFPKATLNLENGNSFTILKDASAPERIYLKHGEILAGGSLRLK